MKKYFLAASLLLLSICTYSQTDSTEVEKEKPRMWLGVIGGFGVSLVRHSLSPAFISHVRLMREEKYKIRLGLQMNYFFERDANKNFNTFINTFISGEYLLYGQKRGGWHGLGVGYLLLNQGDYYKDVTMKIYLIQTIKNIDLKPELIFVNNFKALFPGFTIAYGF